VIIEKYIIGKHENDLISGRIVIEKKEERSMQGKS
jgi:hypothetical protein